jgi:restriction system protein
MAVPPYQDLMRPILEFLVDDSVRSPQEVREEVMNLFGLTEDECSQLIPSGRVTVLQNRVGWALTYLHKTDLLSRPSRARYQITERGKDLLASHQGPIGNKELAAFDEFKEFKASNSETTGDGHTDPVLSGDVLTPEEALGAASDQLREALVAGLIDQVMKMDWQFFEHLVLDLLAAMGYGGKAGATQHLGGSGDEGVDGVIREDALGLDLIYVQAKHWVDSVSRPEMQKFMGALAGKNASKGVFITTSSFSKSAIDYADQVGAQIILIDGKKLAELMIDYGVGVGVDRVYEVKSIDLDFFERYYSE